MAFSGECVGHTAHTRFAVGTVRPLRAKQCSNNHFEHLTIPLEADFQDSTLFVFEIARGCSAALLMAAPPFSPIA